MAELFDAGDEGIVLHGGVCICGLIFFPFQQTGCERCGAFGDALKPKALGARGTLLASAEVHLKTAADITTPYTIGEIRLDSGPVIRALLAAQTPSAPCTVQAGLASEAVADPRHALLFAATTSKGAQQ